MTSRCPYRDSAKRCNPRVPVRVGQISRVDLTLQVGAMSETITVQSAAELLQTDKADVHTELKSTEITNLPLNRFRNYQALVVLVPGSLPPAFQNAETDTPQRSLNMTVNGQDGAANTTLTDGTRNVNVGLPHHNVYIAPAETIESVNITTSSMDAEEGMAAGVAITRHHQVGHEHAQRVAVRVLQQREAECNAVLLRRGRPTPKLPIERQTFGGTLGGPIRRNQLFFFGSYEGYLGRQELFAFFNVPSAAIRNGDFSSALNANGTLQRIYDPLSGDLATGTGRVQFENNTIPAGRINAISKQLSDALSAAERRGHRGRRLHEQLPDGAPRQHRPTQLRRQGQLEPDAGASALGQIQPHERAWSTICSTSRSAAPIAMAAIRRCISSPAARPGRSDKSLLLDSAFGVSMIDQFCSSPDFGLGNLGLDYGHSGHERSGARRSALRGHAGIQDRVSGARQFTDVDARPIATRGPSSFSTNVTKVAANHDFRLGYRRRLPAPGQLAAGTGEPARAVRLRHQLHAARSAPARRPGTSTTSTRRSCSASSAPRARAISTSCSPAASGSMRCSSATAGT